MKATRTNSMGIVIRLAALAVLIGAGWFGWVFVSEAYLSVPAGELVSVEITSTDLQTVSSELQSKHLIASAFRFRTYHSLFNRDTSLKPGTYALRPGTAYRDLVRALALGPARREVQLTIIEGWTVDEIAALLDQQEKINVKTTAELVGRSVDKQPFASRLRNDFPFLQNLPPNRSLEGYLFPDTYRVWADQLPDSLILKQLQEFSDKFGKALPGPASEPLKTLDDVVTLASIVEGEVRNPDDMKIVAGIFLNRMRIGMRLQTDASINYYTGSGRSRSTSSDLQLDTPYNSYKYAGLPPSPVGNPGSNAIQAVLDPAKTDYFYFLTDAQGRVYYAKTLDEHAENRQKAGF